MRCQPSIRTHAVSRAANFKSRARVQFIFIYFFFISNLSVAFVLPKLKSNLNISYTFFVYFYQKCLIIANVLWVLVHKQLLMSCDNCRRQVSHLSFIVK